MALNNLGMGIVFFATDRASVVVKNLSQRFLGLQDVMKQGRDSMGRFTQAANPLGTALTKMSIGLGVATAGAIGLWGAFKLAEPAGKFLQGVAAVGAVSRATSEELKLLRRAAIDAGIATQFSPDEAIAGLTSLATAGLNARDATQALIPVLDLAAGSMGQLGVAGAAEAVVGTLKSYQQGVEEATLTTDRLLKITQLTNFQTRDFSVGLSKAAAAGAVFGQGLNDVLITMGVLRNANIDASSSATAFREATRRLGSDQRAQAAITQSGVDVFDKQSGKMRSVIDIILDLSEKTKGLTDQERLRRVETAFGARGLLAFNAVSKAQVDVMREGRKVTLQGREAIAYLREEMDQASGTAAEFREKLLNTFEGQKTLLRGTLQTIAVVIGEPFAKVLKPLVRGVVETFNTLLTTFDELPDSVKSFIASAVVIGSITAIVVGLGAAFVAVAPLIASAAVAAAPFLVTGLQIAAVVGLVVGALYLLKKAWDSNFAGIQDSVLPVIEKVSLALRSLWALLTQGEISGQLAEDLTKAENEGVFKFVEGVSQAVAAIKAIFEGMWVGVEEAIDALSDTFSPVIEEIGSLFSEVFSAAKEMIEPILDLLGFEGPGTEGIGTLKTIGKWIFKAIIWPFQGIIKTVAWVVRAFVWLGRSVVWVTRVGIAITNFLLTPFYALIDLLKGPLRQAWDAVSGWFVSVWEGVSDVVMGIVEGIRSVFISVINTVIKELNRVAYKAGILVRKTLEATPGVERKTAIAAAKRIWALRLEPVGAEEAGASPGSTARPATPSAVQLPATPPRSAVSVREEVVAALRSERRVRERRQEARIQFEGEVVLNGRALGEVQAEEKRDSRARRGQMWPSFGGE